MQVDERTQVKITLNPAEYEVVMRRLKNSNLNSVSDLLKKAVIDFCEGGYTPSSKPCSDLRRATA